MSYPHTEKTGPIPSCACDHAGGAEPIVITEAMPVPAGVPVFRIPTMDCAAEEGEIRHALADLPGLRGLSFQLGARTLAIDAPTESIAQALEAIRRAGFKPTPIFEAGGHIEAQDHGRSHGGFALPEGLPRYALALLLAFGAESVSFFAPHTLIFSEIGRAHV